MPRSITTVQLLQGLQKKDPRMYDLINSIIIDVDGIQNVIAPVRTLSKSTTGGAPPNTTVAEENFFNILVAVSLRI